MPVIIKNGGALQKVIFKRSISTSEHPSGSYPTLVSDWFFLIDLVQVITMLYTLPVVPKT